MNERSPTRAAALAPPAWELRRADSRGELRNGWLQARFSFSFGAYRDPARERFGPLLALNEDRVRPGTGFAMHAHEDLEILMLPRSGSVEHRDSQGRLAIVRPGEVQFMRAGSGIRHSQMNPSADEADRHLQVWLEPRRRGLPPQVQQRRIGEPQAGAWTRLASGAPSPEGGAIAIDADAEVLLGRAAAGAPLLRPATPGRALYLHLVDGEAQLRIGERAALPLGAGDAVAFFDAAEDLRIESAGAADLLRFDLAAPVRPFSPPRPPGAP